MSDTGCNETQVNELVITRRQRQH